MPTNNRARARKTTEGDRKATKKIQRSNKIRGKARTAEVLGKSKKAARLKAKSKKVRAKADNKKYTEKKKNKVVSKGTLKEKVVAASRQGLGGEIAKARAKRKANKKSVTRFKKK